MRLWLNLYFEKLFNKDVIYRRWTLAALGVFLGMATLPDFSPLVHYMAFYPVGVLALILIVTDPYVL
ncbi:MAG: hypothetical protein WC819_05810 [Parcubacteria group bacterium]|jgi:hypothetical protein